MCFSANASFTAGIILAIVGTCLLKKVNHQKLLPLTMIPWFFAIQQTSEGFVWLSFPDESFAKYIFLFFAYVFWPIWVPFATWFAEKNQKRKQLLAIVLGMGIVTGCALLSLIPLTETTVYRSSISYKNNLSLDMIRPFLNIFYVICSIVPLFLSSIRRIWIISFLIMLVGIIILLIDHFLIVSMWCFFAAIISIAFFWVLPKESQSENI